MIAIASLLSTLALTDFQTIMSTSTDSEFSDFASTLVRARAYAMANNTYVFVGIQEVDASVSDAPGVAQSTGANHYGRIAVSIVASNNGTSGYANSINAPTSLNSSSTTSLTPVASLRNFNNLHILSSSGIANLPNAVTGASSYNLASSSAPTSASSLTTFAWPLTGTAQYTFGSAPGSVIQFDPQGEAQIVTGQETDSILQWIEIDLEPTHGNNVPGTTSHTTAAILIDGPSGAVSIYRS